MIAQQSRTLSCMNPFEAVTHPDPYPYYAELATRGLHFDDSLSMWIAPDDASVRAVLTSSACRVRPAPVSGVLTELARVNDGERHTTLRQDVDSILSAIDFDECAAVVDDIESFQFSMPVMTMARLLGVEISLDEVRAFANVVFGGASTPPGQPACRPALLGLLARTLDATAGLIGNAVVAMARDASLSPRDAVDHALRFDPPVHNTRRFVAEDVTIGNVTLRAGDAIVVILIKHPFGVGVHACPGEQLATTIASCAVQAVVDRYDPRAIALPVKYRDMKNARIALLRQPQHGAQSAQL